MAEITLWQPLSYYPNAGYAADRLPNGRPSPPRRLSRPNTIRITSGSTHPVTPGLVQPESYFTATVKQNSQSWACSLLSPDWKIIQDNTVRASGATDIDDLKNVPKPLVR